MKRVKVSPSYTQYRVYFIRSYRDCPRHRSTMAESGRGARAAGVIENETSGGGWRRRATLYPAEESQPARPACVVTRDRNGTKATARKSREIRDREGGGEGGGRGGCGGWGVGRGTAEI